jgi:hypothetical protein
VLHRTTSVSLSTRRVALTARKRQQPRYQKRTRDAAARTTLPRSSADTPATDWVISPHPFPRRTLESRNQLLGWRPHVAPRLLVVEITVPFFPRRGATQRPGLIYIPCDKTHQQVAPTVALASVPSAPLQTRSCTCHCEVECSQTSWLHSSQRLGRAFPCLASLLRGSTCSTLP